MCFDRQCRASCHKLVSYDHRAAFSHGDRYSFDSVVLEFFCQSFEFSHGKPVICSDVFFQFYLIRFDDVRRCFQRIAEQFSICIHQDGTAFFMDTLCDRCVNVFVDTCRNASCENDQSFFVCVLTDLLDQFFHLCFVDDRSWLI